MRPVTRRFPTSDVARALIAAGIAAGLVAVGVFAAFPATREWLGAEGGFLAWAATAGFLIAIVATVVLLVRTRSLPRSYYAVGVVAALGALEAGYSCLAYAPPVLLGIEVDGGASLLRLAHLLGLTPLVVAAVVLPIAAGGWLAHRRGTLRRIGIAVVEHRAHLLAALAALAVAGAWGVGAATDGLAGRFAAELMMFAAAALTLSAAARIAAQHRTVTQWRRRIRPWISEDASRIGGPRRPDETRWDTAA